MEVVNEVLPTSAERIEQMQQRGPEPSPRTRIGGHCSTCPRPRSGAPRRSTAPQG